MALAAGFILLVVLMVVGMPVAIALSISGAVGLYLVGGVDLAAGIVAATPLGSVNGFEWVMLPMFILMANLVMISGIGQDMFDIAKIWVGRIPGGLAHATAITGAGFGAISGSSTAAAATLASTTIPGMIKQGYNPQLAAGVVAISGTLSMLIPPSGAMVIYALLADMSVAHLLIAGVIPGLLVTLTIVLTVLFLIWRHPEHGPSAESYSWGEKIRSLRKAWTFMLLFAAVTVVIYTGVATPTEASALGALTALALSVLRGVTFKQVLNAARSAVETSCMLALIIVGAHLFVYFLTMTQAAQGLIGFLAEAGIDRFWILLFVLLMYLVLGCFMDLIAMLILTIPIVVPLMDSLGYDLIWVAILTIIMGEIGVLTPPLGMNVYVISSTTGMKLGDVFRGSVPHVIAHLILLAVLVAFPALVTWLPSTMD
ncbi:TRAP transporter large permease [Paracoccus sp. SCSIO 75233]|uniref:TRAP transporter large permease n=1 Tax=Paracoccus sp. SCSIO 75233 TaxID=3017782 RepID=UPI0022F05F0B|nr:TRAP transporter large permease subunit [Paracoccus sp. SCSIO 75233]WBU52054.1 TRAP transporter large permease subunit [Paracoccus sp. SCSIO 75233]